MPSEPVEPTPEQMRAAASWMDALTTIRWDESGAPRNYKLIQTLKLKEPDVYEKFTDRARKVVSNAQAEARRWRHEYVGTEHLLIGLLEEGGGVAASVLRGRGLDWADLRAATHKLLLQGPPALGGDSKLPMTPRAKRVIEHAADEARLLGCSGQHVGTEHLLLGMLREQEGIAGTVLSNAGMTIEDARNDVIRLLGLEKAAEIAEGRVGESEGMGFFGPRELDVMRRDGTPVFGASGNLPKQYTLNVTGEKAQDPHAAVLPVEGLPLPGLPLPGDAYPSYFTTVRGRHFSAETLKVATDAARDVLLNGNVAVNSPLKKAAEAFLLDLLGGAVPGELIADPAASVNSQINAICEQMGVSRAVFEGQLENYSVQVGGGL